MTTLNIHSTVVLNINVNRKMYEIPDYFMKPLDRRLGEVILNVIFLCDLSVLYDMSFQKKFHK